MTTFHIADEERAGLSAYMRRILGLDDRASVRLQARGSVLGVWSGPPFGVLALRPVGLVQDVEIDATVSARRLAEGIETPDQANGVRVPASVVGPPWAALLPPVSGWELEAEVPTGAVVDQVRVAVEGFQRRVAQLSEDQRTQPALEGIAEVLWNQPSVGGSPLRCAHAASALGFLGVEGTVASYRAGRWVRLRCTGGSVIAGVDPSIGPGAGLGSLDVLGAFTPR